MWYLPLVSEALCILLRILCACIIAYLPIKAKWVNEERVRLILQILTGYKFVSTRELPWLVNPLTNRRLEIDCYCEELMLGVEFNGEQHYKKSKRFTQDLEYRVYLDRVKEKLCYQNGVSLIIIPYTIPPRSLCPYIISKMEILAKLQDYYIS
jgi:hypothetical protein